MCFAHLRPWLFSGISREGKEGNLHVWPLLLYIASFFVAPLTKDSRARFTAKHRL